MKTNFDEQYGVVHLDITPENRQEEMLLNVWFRQVEDWLDEQLNPKGIVYKEGNALFDNLNICIQPLEEKEIT